MLSRDAKMLKSKPLSPARPPNATTQGHTLLSLFLCIPLDGLRTVLMWMQCSMPPYEIPDVSRTPTCQKRLT